MRTFPRFLLREQSSRIRLVSNVISGGPSLGGVVPLISRDGGGLWLIDYSGISLLTREHVLAYRSIMTGADSGATPIILPICDCRHAPFLPGTGPAQYPEDAVPHSDQTPHSDDTGYAQPVILATIASAAALRATTVLINGISMGALQGGEYFSIAHPTMFDRLYQVVEVLAVTGSIYTVTIRPPLRAAVAGGTVIEFDEPRIVVQLATPDAGAFDLQVRKFANASPQFVEAFPAPE